MIYTDGVHNAEMLLFRKVNFSPKLMTKLMLKRPKDKSLSFNKPDFN